MTIIKPQLPVGFHSNRETREVYLWPTQNPHMPELVEQKLGRKLNNKEEPYDSIQYPTTEEYKKDLQTLLNLPNNQGDPEISYMGINLKNED